MSMQSGPHDITRLGRMRRFAASIGVLALGVLSAVAISACGGSGGGGISSANASELLLQLDAIDELIADGECTTASETAGETALAISPLSSSQLDPELKTALVDGFERLSELASDPGECGEQETTTTEETNTEEEEPTVPTVEEEPPPPETTPTTPTTPTNPGGGGGTGGTGAGGVSP